MIEMVKAAFLASQRKIEIKDFPKPPSDKRTALVKVTGCGVCGTDPHIYDGSRLGVVYPNIPGHEIVGILEEMGQECKINTYGTLDIGDRIAIVPGKTCGQCYYCKTFPHLENLCVARKIYGVTLDASNPPNLFGGFAEYLVLNPDYWAFKLPDNIPKGVDSLIEPFAVALHAVERSVAPGLPYASMGLGPGTTIVIQGAGPIGILATCAARVMGAKVITVDVIKERLRMAKRFGASEVLNVKDIPSELRAIRVREILEGIGADIAIECAGTTQAFEEGIQMIRRGGRYIEMGNFADVGFASVKPSYICRNDIDITGSVIASPWDFRRVLYILTNYQYPFQELITHKFKIDEAEKAIFHVANKRGIKSIIVP